VVRSSASDQRLPPPTPPRGLFACFGLTDGYFFRLPVHIHELMAKARKAELELVEVTNSEPSRAEVASHAGISESRLHGLHKAYRQPHSMDAPLKDKDDSDSRTLEDMVEDESTSSPDETALHQLLVKDLNNVLHTLSDRECGVLRLRYGLVDGEEKTLEEIGNMYEVRKEQ
jgi:RNA polymerase primary sigma factor